MCAGVNQPRRGECLVPLFVTGDEVVFALVCLVRAAAPAATACCEPSVEPSVSDFAAVDLVRLGLVPGLVVLDVLDVFGGQARCVFRDLL
jgi:hypothetical protein